MPICRRRPRCNKNLMKYLQLHRSAANSHLAKHSNSISTPRISMLDANNTETKRHVHVATITTTLLLIYVDPKRKMFLSARHGVG